MQDSSPRERAIEVDKATGDVCWRVALCEEDKTWSCPRLKSPKKDTTDKCDDSSKLVLSDDLFSPVTPDAEDDTCKDSMAHMSTGAGQDCGSDNQLSAAAELVKLHLKYAAARSRISYL